MAALNMSLNKIFYECLTLDPAHGHPIHVFDSTYLPSPEVFDSKEVYNDVIDQLMDELIIQLPETPCSLIVFSSGFMQNKLSWVFGVKMFSKIPKERRDKIRNIYVVHESFFVRTVSQVLANALNIKFLGNKSKLESLIHVSNLAELAAFVDIRGLRISLNVYLFDLEVTGDVELGIESGLDPKSFEQRQYRQLVFDKIFRRLRMDAPLTELVFQRPGSYQKVNILLGVIRRNNYVDLSQWDIYSLGSTFLHFLKNKTKPIFPIDLIPLPINDSYEYTYNTFVSMMMYNGYYELTKSVFKLFSALLMNTETSRHDYKSLSKCLTPTLCQEKVSINSGDRLAVGYRYVKNVLTHFSKLTEEIDRAGIFSETWDALEDRRSDTESCLSSKKSNSESTNSVPTVKVEKPLPLPQRPSITNTLPNHTNIIHETRGQVRVKSEASNMSSIFDENTTTGATSTASLAPSDIPARETDLKNFTGNTIMKSSAKPSFDNALLLAEHMNKLILDNNEKIQHFDKDLREKKKADQSGSKNSIGTAYSDIKSGNKVSRLAALYEERLTGLQLIQKMGT
ncbi:LAMI_0G07558g1_1 [Lachancea mirantina]|uniref:LAMI_0G07558g1_1 n=1 Tax=Lachancea mirantina TaxID=1230905 RepID=A0A1G4K9N9_9SACH|nr:LAMI_0G07558g1_1 [Lachancea mirantina]